MKRLFFGTFGEDIITANAGNNLIIAGFGDDTIDAGAGRDTVFAGFGDDTVFGGAGRDRLFGGFGDDALFGGAGNDLLLGGAGDDLLDGGAGRDRLFGDFGDDTFVFTIGDDPSRGADYFNGGFGHDTLVLRLTAEQARDEALQADIAAFRAYLEHTQGQWFPPGFGFASLNLDVRFIDALVVEITSELQLDSTEDDVPYSSSLLTAVDGFEATELSDVRNVQGLVDGITVDGDVITVDPGADAFQSLAEGEEREIAITFDVTGPGGQTITQSLTFTVTGTNDAPDAGEDVAVVAAEDSGVVSVDIAAQASDVDANDTLTFSTGDLPAGVSLDGGVLSLDTNDASFQSLAQGDTLELVVTVTVSDSAGATDTVDVVFTVTGTNDAPTAQAASATAAEDDEAITLDLLALASDVDAGDTLTVSVGTLPAGVSFDGTTLTLDPGADAFQALREGEVRVIDIPFTATDSAGASVDSAVQLTVTGTNDAPSFGDAPAIIQTRAPGEEAAVIDLAALVSDLDAGDTLSFAVEALEGDTLADGVSLDPATGALTIPADVQATGTQNFRVTVTDSAGATASVFLYAVFAGRVVSGTDGDDVGDPRSVLEDGTRDNDTSLLLDLGAGNDVYETTDAQDTVVFEAGDGFDYIRADGLDIERDTYLINGLSFDAAAFYLSSTDDDDVMIVFDTGETLFIEGIFLEAGNRIVFTETGTLVDMAALSQLIIDGASTDGNDILEGSDYALTLRGGRGNDILDGADGDDTYVFAIGDGNDVIEESSDSVGDRAVFEGRVLADAEFLSEDGTDLRIEFANGDSVLIPFGLENMLDEAFANNLVEFFVFDDVTVTLQEVIDTYLDVGRTGPFATTDLFAQGTVDFEAGGSEVSDDGLDTTYRYSEGDGFVFIRDSGGTDRLEIDGYTLADAEVTVSAQYGDLDSALEISFAGGDRIVVSRFLRPDDTFQIETIVFSDGTEIAVGDLAQALIDAQITDGDDVIVDNNASNTIEAGRGNDVIFGESGDDTYVFNRGDGRDIISDRSGDNTLVLNGYSLDEIVFTEASTSDDLIITFAGTNDSIVIEDGLDGDFETLVVDGFSIDFDDIDVQRYDPPLDNGPDVLPVPLEAVFDPGLDALL